MRLQYASLFPRRTGNTWSSVLKSSSFDREGPPVLNRSPDLSQEGFTLPLQSDLQKTFESYRTKALEIIDAHRIIHPKCIVVTVRPTVASMHFNFVIFPQEHKARVLAFPQENRIIIRANFDWKSIELDNLGPLTILHEALHNTKGGEGTNGYICGPDAKWRKTRQNTPSCYLFGYERYYSNDIDLALEMHLEELNNLTTLK